MSVESLIHKGINEGVDTQSDEPDTRDELMIWREGFIAAARNCPPCRPHEHAFHCSYLAGVAVSEYRKRLEKIFK